MKFSLAIALSHQAELIIMDEPTSGLDPLIRNELLDIFSYLIQDENKGIFFSTHITSDLDKIADYVTLINDGEILFSTTKDEIIDCYGLVKGKKEFLNEDTRKDFIGIKENQFGFEGLAKNRTSINKFVNNGIIIEKPSLEDVMLYFTRRELNV